MNTSRIHLAPVAAAFATALIAGFVIASSGVSIPPWLAALILGSVAAAGAAAGQILFPGAPDTGVTPGQLPAALHENVKALNEEGRLLDEHHPEFGAFYRELNIFYEDGKQDRQRALAALEGTLADVGTTAKSQQASLEQSGEAVSDMAKNVRAIAKSVESLAASAEESGSSILEMSAINDEVAENIQELATSVEETAASIEQMIYSIKEVAKNIEDLSLAAEQTSTSMNEMEASISHVEQNATATARLSEDVIRDAERGVDAVKRTLTGIEEIRLSSRTAGDVIRELNQRIGAIDNIVNVIDDVTEQTNLLALNAAIIAAQSGEHGRGFAVVADEIKDLAERTGASTKEIADLIRGVQAESKNAIDAIARGEQSVEAGVKLSADAESALYEIVESARKSTEMVKSIALATVEQSKGSRVVADAVDRIARTVQQVAAATAEQARGSEAIMRSAERMKTIANHVELSSQEQAKGGRQVATSIEHINEMVRELHTAQEEQARGSDLVLRQLQEVRGVQARQIKRLTDSKQS